MSIFHSTSFPVSDCFSGHYECKVFIGGRLWAGSGIVVCLLERAYENCNIGNKLRIVLLNFDNHDPLSLNDL